MDHYESIAFAVKHSKPTLPQTDEWGHALRVQWNVVVENLAFVLATRDSTFDPQAFRESCGYYT